MTSIIKFHCISGSKDERLQSYNLEVNEIRILFGLRMGCKVYLLAEEICPHGRCYCVVVPGSPEPRVASISYGEVGLDICNRSG